MPNMLMTNIPKTEGEYYQMFYMTFIRVGLLLATISIFVPSSSNSNLLISSYAFISFGLLLMIGFFIQKITSQPKNLSFSNFFLALLSNVGPFLLLFGIVGFSLYLVIFYKNKLDSGYVTSSYEFFSRLSTFFISVQVYIMNQSVKSGSFSESGVVPQIYSSFVYLTGVINVSVVMILYTILKYFSTDGFSNIINSI